MALYLVQHGKCEPKEVDPQQGISAEGRLEVERIASVASHYGIRVEEIVHSGKYRALQTADIFASVFNIPDKLRVRGGLRPLDDAVEFAINVNVGDNRMIVGHLPFLERLTSYLVAGNAEKIVFKFQNGGIVCLDQATANREWYIKWTLMPSIS